MKSIYLGKNRVGIDEKPYFIADVAANHDGDIQRAFKLIELAKESGAHAAKFQNFVAEKIVSKKGFSSLGAQLSHQSEWKKSVFETYKDASIPYDWTPRLKEKCDEVGITYFTSPYDFDSVDHVDPFVEIYKIGSGDITWHDIIEYIAKKGKPVIIATGASMMNEVEMAISSILKHNKKIVLMQCNTNYTASVNNFKHINLNVLKAYSERFPNLLLGLSDHTHGHSTILGAITFGARVFEKHFTDDNNRSGPDHKFAMNTKTWRQMVDASNELCESLGDGIKKIEDNEKETAMVQRRGLRYNKKLLKGSIIERGDIFPLRPLHKDGIQPYEIEKLLGKKLNEDVEEDQHISWEQIKND
tara:strand:- start:230 stop:1303 length:1074 start_codon:yes stop_codon:yes gene_type:complete